MKNEALFRTGSVWKSIISMAVPSIIIILVMVLYNMADMFFVGCLGDTAQVAAVSVVGPVFSILAAVATMLGAGSSAIIARCFGAGEIERGKTCSSLCFWSSFFLGVLVSIGLLVGRVPLLGALGTNAEFFPYAERYLQVLALGAPLFILSNSMAMLVRAEGAVKEGVIGNLLGTLVNCIFDPLFILVLDFGVSGAAAASVLGNLVATVCYLRYIVKHGTVLTVDFRPALKKPQMLGEMLAIGLPNGISSLLAGFASSFSNRLLVTHGTAAVAAMAAAGKTTMIISMIAMAICMGCQPLLAYSYGAGDTKRLKQLLKDLILLTVVFGVLAGAASFAGRNALIGMFIKEEGAFRLGAQLVVYLVLGSPVIGLTYLATNLLQSVGRASGAVVLSLLRQGLLLIPLPSGFVIAPTIISAVHHASEGSWCQLFGDVMVPLSARNGAPDASGFAMLTMRAFGVDDTAGNGLAGLSAAGVFGIGVLVLLAVVTVLAVASLFLPFALRASRMMWVVTLSGGALAVASSRIVVAVDDDGPVAGSVLPGVVFALLGLLACVGLVSGMAVHRFSLLRQGNGSQPVLTRLEGRKAKNAKVHAVFARIGRGVLVAVLVAGAVSCTAASAMEPGSNGLHASRSDDGLPMVATDYLGKDDAHRVLAITAESSTGVRYTTMRTSRGDLMDSSPALRARVADGGHDSRDAVLSSASARLLVSADADAIADISALGYGGLYVVRPSADDGGSQATEQLISNITASEGIQSVVSNTSGVYYRLTLVDSATQRVPQDGMLKQRHLAYRYAWLVCMGVVMGLYCVVAFPRSHRRFIEEDQ